MMKPHITLFSFNPVEMIRGVGLTARGGRHRFRTTYPSPHNFILTSLLLSSGAGSSSPKYITKYGFFGFN